MRMTVICDRLIVINLPIGYNNLISIRLLSFTPLRYVSADSDKVYMTVVDAIWLRVHSMKQCTYTYYV